MRFLVVRVIRLRRRGVSTDGASLSERRSDLSATSLLPSANSLAIAVITVQCDGLAEPSSGGGSCEPVRDCTEARWVRSLMTSCATGVGCDVGERRAHPFRTEREKDGATTVCWLRREEVGQAPQPRPGVASAPRAGSSARQRESLATTVPVPCRFWPRSAQLWLGDIAFQERPGISAVHLPKAGRPWCPQSETAARWSEETPPSACHFPAAVRSRPPASGRAPGKAAPAGRVR